MSSLESSFSEAGESEDAGGGNGNFSDTGSFITNPAYRIAPKLPIDGGGGVGVEKAPRSPRRSVVSDTELEQQPETDNAVSVDILSRPQYSRKRIKSSQIYEVKSVIK